MKSRLETIFRDFHRNINIWSISAFLFAVLIFIPNTNILAAVFQKGNENWKYIYENLLLEYFINTLLIIVFTGIISAVLGIGSAWIVTFYKFPMSRIFSWILILPLVIPVYVGAYIYTGIMGYGGTLDILFPLYKPIDVMNIAGAVFIYSIFLYPYVYILTKGFFEKQAVSVVEAARTMGAGNFKILLRILIPMSRTAIVGGVLLVIMEVLNDFGVVKYFGISTLSTAIFKSWFMMGDIQTALKLAASFMVLIVVLISIEKISRHGAVGSFTTTKIKPVVKKRLGKRGSIFALFFLMIPILLGLIIPLIQLIYWSSMAWKDKFSTEYIILAKNTILLGGTAAVIITFITVVIANVARITDGVFSWTISKITMLGYSIPGAVIAVGIVTLFTQIDSTMKTNLSATLIMLIFAYVVRFATVSFNSIESGFEKIGKKFFESSRILGKGITKTFFQVELKLILPSLAGGFMLLGIDLVKELPLTLILRPFNFNTLATKTFEYAGDEMLPEASIAALILIIISVFLLMLFNIFIKRISKGRKSK